MAPPHGNHILLCFDGSDGSRLAVETTAALFPGRAVTVLHVWTPLSVASVGYGAIMIPTVDEGDFEQAARKVAEEGASLANAAGLVATAETAEATFDGTWHTIVEAAKDNPPALIAIGARGLSTFQSVVLGSVSHGVVQHASCPVLVVPPPER